MQRSTFATLSLVILAACADAPVELVETEAPVAVEEEGPSPAQGQDSPDGPGGSLSAPVVTALSPTWGSATTEVRVSGSGFAALAADNDVRFDGQRALVLSASATELRVRSKVTVSALTQATVTVTVGGAASAPAPFLLVPPGTTMAMDLPVPGTPSAAVSIGADVYIAASDAGAANRGLYRVNAAGVSERVVGSEVLGNDAPLAMAAEGERIVFTTAAGAVQRFDPATGTLVERLAASSARTGALTGIAVRDDGVAFVVDNKARSVLRIAADGAVTELWRGAMASPFAVALSGDALLISDALNGAVVRATETEWPAVWAYGAAGARGIAVVGQDVVVSAADGTLWSAQLATGGAMGGYGHPDGYDGQADALHVTASGDLLLAQARAQAVRRIRAGTTTATLVAVGVRYAAGTVRLEDRWYLTSAGPSLPGLSGAVRAHAPDWALVEVTDAGSSRIVTTSGILGAAARFAGKVAVADCSGKRLFLYDPVRGSTANLLDASDGLTCPYGVSVTGNGDLLYLNRDRSGANRPNIGQISKNGRHRPRHITDIADSSWQLAAAGERVLTLGFDLQDGSAALYSAHVDGGVAAQLGDAGALGLAVAMATGPDGRVWLGRADGQLLNVDPVTGIVSELTEATGASGPAALGSFGFLNDGAAVVQHAALGEVLAVAP